MARRCMECGTRHATKMDPRRPPLELDECLCAGCFEAAALHLIEELEETIGNLKAEIDA